MMTKKETDKLGLVHSQTCDMYFPAGDAGGGSTPLATES
jgi:hypothetical protein